MKHALISTLLGLALGLCSCKEGSAASDTGETSSNESGTPAAPEVSKHEELANEFMHVLEEMTKIVVTASDIESSKKAAQSIGKLQTKIDVIAEKLKAMEPPSNTEKKAINDKMEARDQALNEAMEDQLDKTMAKLNPESQEVIMTAMGRFFQNLDKHGEILSTHFEPAEEK